MQKIRSNSGQGAIILFSMFIVVVLLIVGVTLSQTQSKAITRVIYTETNLKTYYAAQAGLQEAMATRLIPRSNIYAIRYKLTKSLDNYSSLQSNGLLMGNYNFSSLGDTSYVDDATTGVRIPFPDSGVIYAPDNTSHTIPSTVKGLRDDLIGTYIYKSVGGGNEIDPLTGKPSNNIKGRVTIYSIGYSVKPDDTIDRFGLQAEVDFDRTDNDPSNADEIEGLTPLITPNEINTIESIFKTDENNPPKVSGFTANTTSVVACSFGPEVPPYKSLFTATGSGSGSCGTKIDVGSQIRVFFDKGIDPRTFRYDVANPTIVVNGPSGTYGDFTMVPNMPISNSFILLPAISHTNFLEYDSTYSVNISGVYDFEGNAMAGTVSLSFNTEEAPADTDTPTATDTHTNTPTDTYTASNTFTETDTATDTNTSTQTYTASDTWTPSDTGTSTHTHSPSPSPLPPTVTYTSSDTDTPTETYTPSDTFTPSDTYTASDTFTPTNTPTITNTPTDTYTPSDTNTYTDTYTPSDTFTNTSTYTASDTFTHTYTPSITNTYTDTYTPSDTNTYTDTYTPTDTPTITDTPTDTHTHTDTPTPTECLCCCKDNEIVVNQNKINCATCEGSGFVCDNSKWNGSKCAN